jgi:flagellar protein FliO/FliZ
MLDLPTLGTYVLALVFVLALIGLTALAAKRFGFARGAAAIGGRRRLAVVEALAIDGKRRLLLVRRDGVEHLLVLGATTETVIETGITPPAAPPRPAAAGGGDR